MKQDSDEKLVMISFLVRCEAALKRRDKDEVLRIVEEASKEGFKIVIPNIPETYR